MIEKTWREASLDSSQSRTPFSELCQKVLVLFAEDRLVSSHFRPVIEVLKDVAREVVVLAHSTGRLSEIEALGTRVIDFDLHHVPRNPMRDAATAWELARIIEAEAPDAVHMVGIRPVIIGSLALKLTPAAHAVVQISGMDALGAIGRLRRAAAFRLVGAILRKPSSLLVVENADEMALLRKNGADPGGRFAILGGAGVDPNLFAPLPQPNNDVPVAVFVGEMTRTNGVDVLLQAFDQCPDGGNHVQLELVGTSEEEDPAGISGQELSQWCGRSGARWLRHVADNLQVWRRADMFVLAATHDQCMPRELLEAAACARPLIVSDVAGGRHFVRDGVEGFVVRPGDIAALAQAMQKLASDRELRQRMGEAARLRVLQGFTEADVKRSLKAAYTSMLGKVGKL